MKKKYSILLTITVLLVNAFAPFIATALTIRNRIPTSSFIPITITPLYYRDGIALNIPFYDYDEAIKTLESWNNGLPQKSEEYETAIKNWEEKCQAIKEGSEDKATFEEYTTDEYVLVPVYYEALSIWVFGWQKQTTKDIVKVIPTYELPPRPKFDDTGYNEAKSAYCYLIGDGLTQKEWRYLRLILFQYRAIERGRLNRDKDDINYLYETGYLDLTPHEKSWKDSLLGTLPKRKYDLSLTEIGEYYFGELIDRCWGFRKSLINYAMSKKAITQTEYFDLSKSNDAIRDIFHSQLSKPEDWSPHGPAKHDDLFGKFALGKEDAFKKFPYTRVLMAVEFPKNPPK
jgi:hypothetical protein